MPSPFRVIWKEASLSCYRKPVSNRRGLGTVGLKGDIPRAGAERDTQLDAIAFQGLLEGSLAFMLLSG